MISRGTIVAALLVIEFAIVGEAVSAVHGGQPAPASAQRTDRRNAPDSRLVEGGPHQTFDSDTHPALTVDIGYADLTIVARAASRIDVSVRASTAYGIFQATGPITAREDGATIHITTTGGRRWSLGDDRMVTLLVPPQTQITVVHAGNIKASGLRAVASFKTIGQGSVIVQDFAAPALHVASSAGRISLHGIGAARLDATSSNGSVEGTALQVRDGSVESDGHVRLGFATGADTLVTAQTNNGRIHVWGFPAAASVTIPDNSTTDSDDHAASQSVRVGAGNGRLEVHSSDGNIDLAGER